MAFRWIHLSDFHFDETKDPYERNTVLKPLLDEIRRRRRDEGFLPDAIFATGDIAYSGKAKEYKAATAFLDELLEASGLEKVRLFIAPGNHDVDKNAGAGLGRTLSSESESVAYFENGKPKYHFQKFKAFKKWYDAYFKGIRKCPDDNTCHPLQYFESDGLKIGVMVVNTALFSMPDGQDHNKLWIGRRNLDAAAKQMEKAATDLTFVLTHHPLDWLNDEERTQIKSVLQQQADFMLRGHLHENEVDSVVNPQGSCFHIAAGACYQTRQYRNRALFCTADIQHKHLEILPVRYEDQPKPKWVLDPSLFDPPDYIGRFPFFEPKSVKRPATELEPQSPTAAAAPVEAREFPDIDIQQADPALLNMVVSILAKSEAASQRLAQALGTDYEATEECRQGLAKVAVTTPLETLFDIALNCQVALRTERPPQAKAAAVIANFMEALLPTRNSVVDRHDGKGEKNGRQDDPFQLLASHATLAEISLARRDKRPAQFRFDEKGKPKGKGQMDQGEGWETGRDQKFEQFEKDVTQYLIEQLEIHIGEDWKYLHNGKSFRESFEQSKASTSGSPNQDLINVFHRVLKQKADKAARELRRNGFSCDDFTFYFLIKSSSCMTQVEKASQDVVLNRLRILFPGIAFLRLAPDTANTALELAPFLSLHELLNPNEDDH